MEEKNKSTAAKTATGRDWTQGHIVGNILKLSWPMALSNTLIMLGPLLDMVWVGRLGAVAMAAMASSGITVGLVVTTVMGLAMGSRAMIARFIGAGDISGANHVAQQSLFISLVFSVAMAIVGFFLSASFLRLLGLDADVVAVGTPFVRVMFIGSAAIAFRLMTEGILQASGDTVTPLWTSAVYFAARVALSPFLIFGRETFPWWPFAGMGIKGAAVAMAIAYSLSTVIMLWILFAGRSRLRVTLQNFYIDLHVIWRIIKIGFPALVSMMQQNLAQLVLVRLMAPFGTVALAAHGIVQRVEMMVVMPAMAVGMGSGVLVGQNLGAGQPERAQTTAWRTFILLESILVVCAAALLLWPGAVVRIFSSDQEMLSTAGAYIRIAVAGFLAAGFWVVFNQSLNGAGDTTPTMIISVAAIWLISMPVAFFLPQLTDLGAYGVRWGIASGLIFNGLVHTVYFMFGRWKRKKV